MWISSIASQSPDIGNPMAKLTELYHAVLPGRQAICVSLVAEPNRTFLPWCRIMFWAKTGRGSSEYAEPKPRCPSPRYLWVTSYQHVNEMLPWAWENQIKHGFHHLKFIWHNRTRSAAQLKWYWAVVSLNITAGNLRTKYQIPTL